MDLVGEAATMVEEATVAENNICNYSHLWISSGRQPWFLRKQLSGKILDFVGEAAVRKNISKYSHLWISSGRQPWRLWKQLCEKIVPIHTCGFL